MITSEQASMVLKAIYENRDRDGLWDFIDEVFGLQVPRVRICPEHDSPFDFICAVFFNEYPKIIAVANRTGGKTLNFAVLDALNSFGFDKCETATVGAIEEQAKKCYSYFRSFVLNLPLLNDSLEDSLQSLTTFNNGSSVQILTGTMSGVNSPHPNKVFIDEIELMSWNILQEAFSMAQTKNGIPAQTILTSSRKFAFGAMERMLEEADKRGYKVFKWCVMEVIEKHDPEICATTKFGKEDCQGRCLECDGYLSFNDAVNKKEELDEDTWLSQWKSKKASASALVYPMFDEFKHVKKLEPDLGAELYLSEDFGFAEGHADVIGFWQVTPSGVKKRIAEIWREHLMDDELIDLVEEKLVELGFVEKRYLELLRSTNDEGMKKQYRFHFNRAITSWACPIEEPSKIQLRVVRGYRIISQTDPEIRKIIYGIPLIRKDLEDDKLFIDESCVDGIKEFKKYANKKRGDGTILKDEPEKKNDNSADEIRYFYINNFAFIQRTGLKELNRTNNSDREMITSGIRDQVF